MHIVRKGRKIRVYQSISVKKKTGNLPCLSALLPSLPKAAVFMVQIFMGQVFIVQTSVVCPFLRYREASHDLSRVLPTACLAAGSPFGVRTASPPYSLSSAVTLPQQ